MINMRNLIFLKLFFKIEKEYQFFIMIFISK